MKLKYWKKILKAKFKRAVLGSHTHAIIVKANNGLFAVDPEDYGVGGILRRDGKYGSEAIEELKKNYLSIVVYE